MSSSKYIVKMFCMDERRETEKENFMLFAYTGIQGCSHKNEIFMGITVVV